MEAKHVMGSIFVVISDWVSVVFASPSLEVN